MTGILIVMNDCLCRTDDKLKWESHMTNQLSKFSPRSGRPHKALGVSPGMGREKVRQARGVGDSKSQKVPQSAGSNSYAKTAARLAG